MKESEIGANRDPKTCDHDWVPVSFSFETRAVWTGDANHRYMVAPQPDLETGRVYCVCMACASHTYVETSWINHRLYGSQDRDPATDDRVVG